MKTILSFVFGVSMCCLLPSIGMAADAAKPAKDAAVKPTAVSGIALTTHRPGGGDHGFGVAPETFGEIVRHDIKDNRVVGSRVIYPGKARAAFIDPSGERVVFIKLDGRLHVMKADGTGLKELAKARNRNASAVAWPAGDWVYYSEEGKAPRGCWGDDEKADTPEKRSIRRVNVVSGEDEQVGTAPNKIWQMSLALTSGKGNGRYAITNHLADLSQPDKAVNSRNLLCGTMVSPSGQFVTEMAETHADLRIWSWDLGTRQTEFHINAWAGAPGDGRPYFMRPRWSANSDNWVVMTHGMDFGATDRSTAALYNWKEQIQIQLTHNACDEGESFWLAGLPGDFSVNELEGHAPYKVELKSPEVDGLGWTWDFGDGATGTGAVGRHTYEKPGHYIAVARKGKSMIRKGVTVLPQKGLRATAVSTLDPRHVLVVFNEPVKIDGAAVKLAFGRAATRLYLEPLGRQLVAEFDRPLWAKDTLVLEKITDRAQSPNAVANPRLPVQRPSWPADATGLVFLWENAKAENRIWDPVISGVREAVMHAGANHFDRDGALVCGQGLSDAGAEAPQQLMAGCKASEALSVEMVVRPENLEQSGKDGMLPLLAMSHGWPNGTFFLSQNKSRLQVALARQAGDSQPQIFDLGALPSAGPHHIVVAMAPKRLALYVDGTKVREVDPSPAKILMMASPLRFGGCNEEWLWKGRLEGIAMYGRFVEEAEAARGWNAYRARLAARKPMDRVVVDARLVAKTPAPELKDMMPYRSALVVYEYAVQKVKDGKAIKDGQVVRVAHWGVRDLKKTPAAECAVGATVPLILERFADHPELEAQFMRDALPVSEADLWTDGQP